MSSLTVYGLWIVKPYSNSCNFILVSRVEIVDDVLLNGIQGKGHRW